MPDPIPDPATVSRTLESAMQLMQNTLAELTQLRVQFAEVAPRMKDIAWLVKVVRDGNGEDSIMTRLRLIETKLDEVPEVHEQLNRRIDQSLRDLTKRVESLDREMSSSNAAKTKVALEDRKGSWQLKVALATGVLSLLGMLFQLLQAALSRGP